MTPLSWSPSVDGSGDLRGKAVGAAMRRKTWKGFSTDFSESVLPFHQVICDSRVRFCPDSAYLPDKGDEKCDWSHDQPPLQGAEESMTGTSRCPLREDLQRFLLGQLSQEEAEPLERHLSECPTCVGALTDLKPHDGLVDVVAVVARSPVLPVEQIREDLLRELYRLPEADTRTQEKAPDGFPPPPGYHTTLDTAEQCCDCLTPPPAPDEIGRFGPYEVLRVLGVGGMGVVYAVRQARPQRIVALKVMSAGSPRRFR